MSLCVINKTESLPRDETFIQEFEQKVKDTIQKHKLFHPEDKVVVAVSGGKDSTVLLHLLKKFGYNIQALTVDVHIGCYTKENLERITRFCMSVNVPLHAKSFREEFGYSVCYMTSMLRQKNQTLGSCTVCGVLRRKVLNQAARGLGTVLATGHNMDDEAQTILMNTLKNRLYWNARLGPKPKLNDGFIQRVKPLYFIPEEDIERYSKMHAFPVKYQRCPCGLTSTRSSVRQITKEQKKNIIDWFMKTLPQLRQNGSRSLQQCTECGEPCSNALCRACTIIQKVKQFT